MTGGYGDEAYGLSPYTREDERQMEWEEAEAERLAHEYRPYAPPTIKEAQRLADDREREHEAHAEEQGAEE